MNLDKSPNWQLFGIPGATERDRKDG